MNCNIWSRELESIPSLPSGTTRRERCWWNEKNWMNWTARRPLLAPTTVQQCPLGDMNSRTEPLDYWGGWRQNRELSNFCCSAAILRNSDGRLVASESARAMKGETNLKTILSRWEGRFVLLQASKEEDSINISFNTSRWWVPFVDLSSCGQEGYLISVGTGAAVERLLILLYLWHGPNESAVIYWQMLTGEQTPGQKSSRGRRNRSAILYRDVIFVVRFLSK